MHHGGHGFIEEWQFVVLDIDNFKLRVIAVFQKVMHPLCNNRGLPSWSRTTDDDSNLYHCLLLPVRSSGDRWFTYSVIMIIFPTCSLCDWPSLPGGRVVQLPTARAS